MPSILVVEDNPDVAELVALHLRDAGYAVETASDGGLGLQMALDGSHDCLVLDLMLPGLNGLEICRRVRARCSYVPIVMLTAKSSETDRVVGLELGSDDYLTKPFSIRELIARIRAVLRRVEALREAMEVETDQPIHVGPFALDPARRRAELDGRSLDLTQKEYDLLLYFAAHPGRVFTRAELLNRVWGYGHAGYEHTVSTHINRLRAKIETTPSRPRWVLTVWGVGYKFFEPGAQT